MNREHLTRLSELMEQARLTDPALAELAGTSKQQVFKLRRGDRKMSKEWADRLAPHLGVEWAELMAEASGTVASGPRPRRAPRAHTVSTIIEIDVETPGVVEGAEPSDLKFYQPGSLWQIPAEALPSHAGTDLVVIKVIGDAMEPDYPAGSRVVVDCGVRRPAAPGVYVLWDGAAMTLKQVEHLAGASPAVVRISSINPRYAAYERPLEDVAVAGRVAGQWRSR